MDQRWHRSVATICSGEIVVGGTSFGGREIVGTVHRAAPALLPQIQVRTGMLPRRWPRSPPLREGPAERRPRLRRDPWAVGRRAVPYRPTPPITLLLRARSCRPTPTLRARRADYRSRRTRSSSRTTRPARDRLVTDVDTLRRLACSSPAATSWSTRSSTVARRCSASSRRTRSP